MKNRRLEAMIQILSESKNEISSGSLAKMIGTSEKTVRNYIKEANESGMYHITSSNLGYRLVQSEENSADVSEYEKRTYYVFSKLLTARGNVSVFDIADEMHLSESTIINHIFPSVRKTAQQFDLQLVSHNYLYSLEGKESQKRKLIGYLITSNSYGYLTSLDALKRIFPELDPDSIITRLHDLCKDAGIFLNDYSLNNFLVHLLVIWIRLQSKQTITVSDEYEMIERIISKSEQKEQIMKLASQIVLLFEESGEYAVSRHEYQQIVSLITLSVDLSFVNIADVIEKSFLENMQAVTKEISARYGIQEFDHSFIMQFSLHMYNACKRATLHISYPNPLAAQIKADYSQVYDMAVFVAHRFSSIYHITLSEDEIAFIAFHIGAYIENNKNKSNLVSCIIISENYHDFSMKLMTKIEENFQNELTVSDIMSLSNFKILRPHSDLLITAVDDPGIRHDHKVVISPILTKYNMRSILNEIEKIEEEKEKRQALILLKDLLDSRLFTANLYLSSPEEYIRYMGRICESSGFATAEFVNDALLREQMSSTAFTRFIAIPHTISQYAIKSFIYIIKNDIPVQWGNKTVQFILMIGITEIDMKHFSSVLTYLINLFSDQEMVLKLHSAASFNELKSVLLSY